MFRTELAAATERAEPGVPLLELAELGARAQAMLEREARRRALEVPEEASLPRTDPEELAGTPWEAAALGRPGKTLLLRRGTQGSMSSMRVAGTSRLPPMKLPLIFGRWAPMLSPSPTFGRTLGWILARRSPSMPPPSGMTPEAPQPSPAMGATVASSVTTEAHPQLPATRTPVVLVTSAHASSLACAAGWLCCCLLLSVGDVDGAVELWAVVRPVGPW